MKRLLRHRDSREFLAETGWTRNPQLAAHYPDSMGAIQAVQRRRLTDMEMVLQVKDCPSHLDLVLPLQVKLTNA